MQVDEEELGSLRATFLKEESVIVPPVVFFNNPRENDPYITVG